MTIKQCAFCKKNNGTLVEIEATASPSYRGKFYHGPCFLSAQGTIHEEGDPKDLCESGCCNATLFQKMMHVPKATIVEKVKTWTRRMFYASALWLLAASHIASYLNLSFLLYYLMIARLFWSMEYFGILCGCILLLLVVAYRSNVKRLAFILGVFVYLIYYGEVDRLTGFYYDVLILPKIMLVLFLGERGIRVCMLWRIVNHNQLAKEYGSLMWTVQAWPFLHAFPLYLCSLTGLGLNVFCYMARMSLPAPLYTIALMGAVSWMLLLYPVAYRAKWRVRMEELISLPF